MSDESEQSDNLSEESGEEYSEEDETQPENEEEAGEQENPQGETEAAPNTDTIEPPQKEPEVPIEKHLTKADIAQGISQLARTGTIESDPVSEKPLLICIITIHS